MVLKTVFWGALAALAWTHVGYPAAASPRRGFRPRPVRKGDELPTVSVIVAAHDEEAVIERRLENLLELDYPPEQARDRRRLRRVDRRDRRARRAMPPESRACA